MGVVGVVAGMFVLILSDAQSLNTPAANAFLGDVLALIGSTGYGVSNVLVEKYVANTSVSEVLSQMGMYGTLVSIIQLFVLERQEVLDAPWSAASIGVLAVFGILSFSFYTLAPVLFRMAGATFFNISLQTSNLYGLIIGLVFFDAKMTVLYGVAYVLFIVGILVYNTKAPLYLDQLEKKVDV
jgi:solute carrier family 35 protein F1/2